jgi:hypothetical protein
MVFLSRRGEGVWISESYKTPAAPRSFLGDVNMGKRQGKGLKGSPSQGNNLGGAGITPSEGRAVSVADHLPADSAPAPLNRHNPHHTTDQAEQRRTATFGLR